MEARDPFDGRARCLANPATSTKKNLIFPDDLPPFIWSVDCLALGVARYLLISLRIASIYCCAALCVLNLGTSTDEGSLGRTEEASSNMENILFALVARGTTVLAEAR